MIIEFGKPFIDENERSAVEKILRQPVLVHGKNTSIFEDKFCNFTKSKYSISVSSCTAGLHLGYLALGVGPGDEVIVTAQSHVATAHAIEYVGAKPIFIDCELDYGNIDINQIESKINKRTKAISVVHFLGMPVDMLSLKKLSNKYKLYLIEDCALAIGSRIGNKHVGTFGDIGSFSFYPVKHITTIEGGMITTQNKKIAECLKKIRAFGYEKNKDLIAKGKLYDVDKLGFNYRMNEVEACIGIEQLKKLNIILKKREKNSRFLRQGLSLIDNIKILKGSKKNFTHSHYCVSFIILKNNTHYRKFVMEELLKQGIRSSVYYPGPIPNLKFYKQKYKFKTNSFPNSYAISNYSIALPVGPHLSVENIEFMLKKIKGIFNEI